MKRILCFGDSLTFGKKPMVNVGDWARYDKNTRWTGVLQEKLGRGYEIIEEGLPSRTIDLDDPTPGKEGRNGEAYIGPCLESHVPLDIIILFLGTNDTKDLYDRSAEDIGLSMKTMIDRIDRILSSYEQNPQIILVAPPKVNINADKAGQWYSKAPPKLELLAALYEQIANDAGFGFVNLYDLLDLPDTVDGIHLDEDDNSKIAELMYQEIIDD